MSLRVTLLFAVLIFVAGQAQAQRRYPKLEWGLRAGISAIYNDNLLRFSKSDQLAFKRFDPSFRTPMETLDDGETEILLAPTLQWRAPAMTMVNVNYRFKATQRVQNDHTNYQTHSFSANVRPRVRGYKWSARASVFTIPSFYLRAYRDRDFGTYDDCRFENWEYSGEFSYKLADPLWMRAQVGYGTIYYGSRFTEYDSEYQDIGLEADYSTPWSPRVTARYTRRISDNVGKSLPLVFTSEDEGQLIVEDTEYGDGDFSEDEFRLAIRSRVKVYKAESVNTALSSRIRRRVYTTERSLESDPFHRGRLDTRWELTPSIGWSLSQAWDVNLYFTYEERSSQSDYVKLAQVKDFVRREVGIGFMYRIR